MEKVRYIQPESFHESALDDYVSIWKQQGFLLFSDLIPSDLFASALSEVNKVFPPSLDEKTIEDKAFRADFGSNGLLEFPCPFPNVNQLSLAKPILQLSKRLLNTDEIRLIQADVWAKYGSKSSFSDEDNRDQRMHMDFGNNTLLHPPSWNKPEAVACIISFDHTQSCGGGTALVPREGDDDEAYQLPYMKMPGMSDYPWFNDRSKELSYFKEHHPHIYEFRTRLYGREFVANYKPGTILFYRHDLWHRGTPLVPGKIRRVQNLGFKRADCDWVTTWNPGWVRSMYDKGRYVEKLLPKLTIEQRSCLGFPKPGSSYWTPENFESVRARWEPWGMDLSPYKPEL